jgi:hypothetical protein
MNAYFLENAIAQFGPAGRTVSGFAYTNEVLGARYAQVELVGPKGIKPNLVSFLLRVPGLPTHYRGAPMSVRSSKQDVLSYDEKRLREALEGLPCVRRTLMALLREIRLISFSLAR